MKKIVENIKIKLKSEKGFTMQDIIGACIMITIFVGTISALMTYVYKTNMETRLTARMAIYAVEILEDIDKVSYEEAQTKTGEYYRGLFSIPEGFDISLEFNDYEDGEEDLIKIVNLRIAYTLQGKTNEYEVQKLKIKETESD